MQLPFNTQWTELKDFIRTVCEVDYVEVFNASTHAWVRVLGYQDYCKAFRESTPVNVYHLPVRKLSAELVSVSQG